MALLDPFDLWKGWWIPTWIIKRLPNRGLPTMAGQDLQVPVCTSPEQEESCRKGIRRSAGLEVWTYIYVLLPAAVMATLAVAGLVITVHPSASEDPQFVRDAWLPFLSLSAGLASAAVLWVYRSRSLYRRRVGASFPITSAADLSRLLRSCWKAHQGDMQLLELDRQITRYTNSLGWFAAYGIERERRRAALRPHIAKVQQALETEMSNVLRDGVGALPRLARLLAIMLDRSVQGRWMGMLDETDLPLQEVDLVTAQEDKYDRRAVLGGSAAAAAIMGVAITAGVPASAAAPAALTALIGPAVMWGSEKLGSKREYMQTMTTHLDGAAADPAANTPPASATAP
ncbi:hypothetical protein ACWET9_44040 [Streptomyces sp. NPDC004059]